MNKVCGIALMSLPYVSALAIDKSSLIEKINVALNDSDVIQVKLSWMTLDNVIESLDEKQRLLECTPEVTLSNAKAQDLEAYFKAKLQKVRREQLTQGNYVERSCHE